MAQSLNKTVELHTTGVSYMAIGGKVGKFLIGDVAIEFYPDINVEQYIQIPWTSITQIGANVSGKRISRHFEILTDKSKFLFASKDSGKILKIAREINKCTPVKLDGTVAHVTPTVSLGCFIFWRNLC